MPVSRRFFLKSSALALPGGLLFPGPLTADGQSRYIVVIITDIEDSLRQGGLADIARIFFDAQIPVTCAADPKQVFHKDGTVTAKEAGTLLSLAAAEPGLFEIALRVQPTEETGRFFQMRHAQGLRERVGELPDDPQLLAASSGITTLILPDEASDFDPPAYRGSGFRVFLGAGDPEAPRQTAISVAGRDQMQVNGRVRIGPAEDPSVLLDQLFSDSAPQPGFVLELSLSGLNSPVSDDDLDRIAKFAGRLNALSRQGILFATRPADLLLQSGVSARPNAAVLFRATPGGAGPDFKYLAEELAEKGVPVTWDSDDEDHSLTGAVLVAPGAGPPGLRSDARFQLAAVTPDNGIVSLGHFRDPIRDAVLIVEEEGLDSLLTRARLLNQLSGWQASGQVRFHSLPALVAYLFAPDPVLEKHRSATRRFAAPPEPTIPLQEDEKARLAEDARVAWHFIETYSHPATGLCAGTVRGGGGGLINRNATLWDVASQMFGIRAASQLGLISGSEARGRIALILNNLPAAQIAGVMLPPSFFSTATKRPAARDFDVCDTGRFLNALQALEQSGFVTPDQRRNALSRWDLTPVVRDRRLHNFTRGRWVDATQSFCTPYVKSGFTALGADLFDPFADTKGGDQTTRSMRLLYRAAETGHVGTEPLLLPAVEGDDVPVFRDLAKVLFDAQLSWYEESGTLKCASETLLDFEPWFSYQGLRLDRSGPDAWVVAPTVDSPEFQTPEFKAKAEVISSKSAYLWMAAHPHPHSSRLVSFIRENARYEGLGFAAGVFAQSQMPMDRYSDVNTNGIILAAIARILRG